MTRTATSLVSIVLLAFTSATALGGDDMVSFYGVGANSCGSFLSVERGDKNGVRQRDTGRTFFPERAMYEQWLSGFVTAFNAQNLKNPSVRPVNTDTEGLMAWVKSYCEKNPTQYVWVAANALVQAESRTK